MPDLALTVAIVFVMTAVFAGSLAALVLNRPSEAKRRLDRIMSPGREPRAAAPVLETLTLTERPGPAIERVSKVLPTSSKEMSRIRRRLARAGFSNPSAPVIYAALEVVLPVIVGLGAFGLLRPILGSPRVFLVSALLAIAAYLLPGMIVGRLITRRQQQIRNALPDALDLIIVCVEAGLSLDQALLKAREELALSHQALADELQHLTNEIRAGKPRMEAFRTLADRTKVDDVRALVAMLIQTDRFGTSIAQALRTHAETARTLRRQRAEERAAKLGVKLVFPLVFCLFPAMYVVTLGPGAVRIIRILIQGIGRQYQ
jgi:tight adherence protein C